MSKPKANQHVIFWDIDGALVNVRASRVDKHATAVKVFLDHDLPSQERAAEKRICRSCASYLKSKGLFLSRLVSPKCRAFLMSFPPRKSTKIQSRAIPE
jgi:hypothetical protein